MKGSYVIVCDTTAEMLNKNNKPELLDTSSEILNQCTPTKDIMVLKVQS